MVWMRVPGDIVFACGTLFLALFAIRLATGNLRRDSSVLPVMVPAKA
jgi:nitric oxide reductase subunit B